MVINTQRNDWLELEDIGFRKDSKKSKDFDLEESVAGRIVEPGIVGRATVAGLHVEDVTGQFFGAEGARVGHVAGLCGHGAAVLLPRLELIQLFDGTGILHPLDDLRHGDEVDVVVLEQGLVDPVEEGVEHFRVVLEPSGVVEESQRGAIGVVMALEVVVEEVVELLAVEDVGARVDHGATGQVFVVLGVFATVQLVEDHLPDGVAAGGALLLVAVAVVGHAEVERVRPQWRILQGNGDGRIVEEGLLFDHGELVVAADAQVRGAHTHDRVVGDVGELVDDETRAGHFLGPVVHRSVRPESLVLLMTAIDTTNNINTMQSHTL